MVHQIGAEVTFDIDAHDLPKGSFRSPSFLGTMLAVGLAFAGEYTPRLWTATNKFNFVQGGGTFSLVAPLLGVNNDISPDPNYL